MVYSAKSDDTNTESNFTRREAIVVTTTGTNTPSNYQAKLTITYEYEMQSDFDDIRFNTKDGRYIDYWIESYVASTSAIVWLELPDAITDPGSDTIWMYYGNASLSDGGVGDDVFSFFDDFNRSNSVDVGNGWTEDVNIYSIDTNQLKGIGDGGTTGTGVHKAWATATDSILEYKVKFPDSDDTVELYQTRFYGDAANKMMLVTARNNYIRYLDDSAYHDIQVYTPGNWYTIKHTYRGTSWNVQVDSETPVTGITFYNTTTTDDIVINIHGADANDTVYYDWIFVRKYIADEPTISHGPVYIIKNWSFENWSSGPTSAPDHWTNSGLAETHRDTKHKFGTYSIKASPNNTTDHLYQSISSYDRYKGIEITFGCWCWTDVANQMRLSLIDSVGQTNSSYHSGSSTWEWLTVTRTIDSVATYIRAAIFPSVNNGYTIGYADAAVFAEGSEIPSFESETVILDDDLVLSWMEFETIDSISVGAKTFKCQIENTDNDVTDIYDAFDTAVIFIDGTTVFNGRIEEIIPNESEATLELAGKDYMGDLIGEYIIENYGISQDLSNNEAAGSDVVIEITDTTGFEVDDEIKIEDDNDAETAVITAVVANTSITVDTLTNSYTTAANAKVTVGRPGSYIVNDLVLKYGASMTRVGIQTSTNKFIILFKGITAFDAIQYIADSEEFEFGQDQDKDFFYQPRTFEDSGLSIDLDQDDVMDYSFPRPGYEIINRVDIYGGTSGGVQVAIRVEDPTSQNYYGIIKGMTIIDEKITTELQAQARANAILSEKAWVIQIGELSVLGYETLQAGQLVSLANFDSIDDGLYLVTEKMHLEPPGNTLIKVAEYRAELEDVIIDLLKRMRAREKEAMDEDAFQTKFLNFYVTSLNTDTLSVIQVDINDGYIAAHKTNSLAGRGYDGVGGNQLKVGRYQTETVIV